MMKWVDGITILNLVSIWRRRACRMCSRTQVHHCFMSRLRADQCLYMHTEWQQAAVHCESSGQQVRFRRHARAGGLEKAAASQLPAPAKRATAARLLVLSVLNSSRVTPAGMASACSASAVAPPDAHITTGQKFSKCQNIPTNPGCVLTARGGLQSGKDTVQHETKGLAFRVHHLLCLSSLAPRPKAQALRHPKQRFHF